MCVARIRSRKGAILVSPREGATDGPHQPYPTARPNGRGPYRSLLPRRGCLHAAQPRWEALRAAQAALGLGGHRTGPLAAAAGRAVRALLFARHSEVFLSPVPRGRRAPPFLVPSKEGTQAPVLPGAPATASRLRVGGRSRNPSDRLHPACRAAPQAGRSVRGFSGGGGMGEVGFLQRLRGEAAPLVRHKRGAHLLRDDARPRGGGAPGGGVAPPGEHPRRSRPPGRSRCPPPP